jgi:hypothetical protein
MFGIKRFRMISDWFSFSWLQHWIGSEQIGQESDKFGNQIGSESDRFGIR